jgi:phage terminase large subunit GpA-like protein
MRCPHCGAITEVSEKRGAYRERRCSNPACRSEFTTCENLLTHSEHRRLNARALAQRGASALGAPEENSKVASAA